MIFPLLLMMADIKQAKPIKLPAPTIAQDIESEKLRRDLTETQRQLVVVQKAVILLLERSRALELEVQQLREDLDLATSPLAPNTTEFHGVKN